MMPTFDEWFEQEKKKTLKSKGVGTDFDSWFEQEKQKTQQKVYSAPSVGASSFGPAPYKSGVTKVQPFPVQPVEQPSFSEDLGSMLKNTWQGVNPFDDVSFKEAFTQNAMAPSSKVTQELNRGGARTVDSATFGSLGALTKATTGDNPRFLEQREGIGNNVLDFASTGAGYLIPGIGFASGLRGTKAGANLAKGMSTGQKAIQLGKEGAVTGLGIAALETPARAYINPDQSVGDHLKRIAIETGIGAVGDPALYGMVKGAGKGINALDNKLFVNMDNLPKPTGPINPRTSTLNQLMPDSYMPSRVKQTVYNQGLPKDFSYRMPDGTTVRSKAEADNIVQASLNRMKQLEGQVNTSRSEFDNAVQRQYEYMKQSMGKGVEIGTTSNDMGGNFREVTGRYAVSQNPKWYQDFYSTYSRRPNNAELRQMAEDFVRNGFDDELGSIPSWQTMRIQDIDNQIDEITSMMQNAKESDIPSIQDTIRYLENERNVIQQMDELPNQYNQAKRDYEGIKQAVERPLVRTQQPKADDPFRPLDDGIQAMASDPVPIRQSSGTKQFKEMGIVERAINAVKQKAGSANVKYQPITQRELLGNMRKRLGVTIRDGRLGNVHDSVQGFFKVQPEVIRSKRYGDIPVISHEIGHNLDKRFKLSNAQFDSELMKLGQNTSRLDYKPEQVRKEGLAEFIRLFLTDPEQALKEAPNFSKHFDSVLPKDVKNALMKTQADVDRWIEQGPEFQFRGKIDRTGKDSDPIDEKFSKVYSQMVDRFNPFKKVEEAVKGKVGDASNSLYKKARLSVGAPKKAEQQLKELQRILKPINKYGYSMKDVGDYVASVHALELEELGYESGFTRQQIERTLQKYDSTEMRQLQKEIVQYNNSLLDILVESGRISQDAVNAMKKKYPNYVPFFRYFEDDLTSGFSGKGFANLDNPVKRLKGSTKNIIDPFESMIKNTFAVIDVAEKNKVGRELLDLTNYEGSGQFVEIVTGNKTKKDTILTVYKDGNPVQLKLEPELYKAVQQLDEQSMNIVTKILSVPANTLRAGATLTPEFMVRNPIRDQFQAWIVSNTGYNPIIDLPQGLIRVIGNKLGFHSEIYEQWVKSGGAYGNYLSQDRNYLREQLRQLKREGNPLNKGFRTITNPKEWLRFLQALSEISEEATKVGEFRKAIKKGATYEEAAFQSRDLMDFGRAGSSIKQLNRVVAFLNANIQGKDRIARAYKNNPVRTTIRSITGVTLPTIGAYLAMENYANEKQKEAWDNTPRWMKDTFFILPIPGTDELMRVPKPFDFAPLFSNLPEHLFDWYKENDPRSWEKFAKDQATQMSIPYMLTGIAPIIENITNYSFFTQGSIVPQRDQDLEPKDQYGPTTSLTAKTIGKYTNYSPYKVDNFIRGYGAGLGKYATSGMDKMLEQFNIGSMPPQPEKKWSELPVINAFTVDQTGGGRVMSDFYDKLDELKNKRNSAKKNESDYPDEKKYKTLDKASRDISELRRSYREIQGSYKLNPQEKRRQLDELDRKMNELARKSLEQVR